MVIVSVRGFKSHNLIGPFADIYSRIVQKLFNIIRSLNIIWSQGQRNKKTNGTFSQNGERALLSRLEVQRETQGGRRRRTNLDYNSLACVCHVRVSEERTSGSRSSVWRPSPTPALTAVFCRSVRSGRVTTASLLALLYYATNREAEGDSE